MFVDYDGGPLLCHGGCVDCQCELQLTAVPVHGQMAFVLFVALVAVTVEWSPGLAAGSMGARAA